MTPLERRSRLLLRAYPAWYRRQRAGEMLDTLLEASAPGRRWPSVRDARALLTGGLRARGLAWCLSVLWAGLGAAGAGYAFILSAHIPEANAIGPFPPWVGEPDATYAAAVLGGLAWLVLTIPVLVAGLVRLRRTDWTVLWTVAWAAGLPLAVLVAAWQTSALRVFACSKGQGCALSAYRYPIVSWGELAVFAGWLALGAAMTLILARPVRRRLPGASSRSSQESSL